MLTYCDVARMVIHLVEGFVVSVHDLTTGVKALILFYIIRDIAV